MSTKHSARVGRLGCSSTRRVWRRSASSASLWGGRHPAPTHRPPAAARGPRSWNIPEANAGLHPTAMLFVAFRGAAVLGSDVNNDTVPSSAEGVDFPIHVLAIVAMGVHLLDYLQFEDLRVACERASRWEFLFVAAPLRIVGGTGSPLNPVAVL